MASRRFLNPAQPQTLVIAVYLLYMNSAFLLFDLLRLGLFPLPYVILIVGGIAAGYGVANEFKWAYPLAIAAAVAPFVVNMYYTGNPLNADILSLMFEIALVCLLLHPQSRDYQRIWFK
ncbi:MAG: hypothetical protein M3Y04_02095 [Actinomycetota bacterium]|nr:hypothetical protein [Actinomycetota bacterium]